VIAGVLLVIPVGLTYLVLRFVWDLVYGALRPLLDVANDQGTTPLVGTGLRVASVVLIIVTLYAAGSVAPTVLGRQVVRLWHRLVDGVPVVRSVYRIARLFTEMFGGTTNVGTNRVVLLEFPRPGILGLGMVTSRYVTAEGEELLTVYVPTIPNPTSGFFAIVAEDQVIDTDITLDEAMRIVVSGGLLTEEITRAHYAKRDGS
jgi:uncharacterized membrane protein